MARLISCKKILFRNIVDFAEYIPKIISHQVKQYAARTALFKNILRISPVSENVL